MPKRATKRTTRTTRSPRAGAIGTPPVIYIHGIGRQPAAEDLKRRWDLALFGREMGRHTRMAYWADILHGGPAKKRRARASSSQGIDVDSLLREGGVSPDDEDARTLADGLMSAMGVQPARGPRKKVLPLPAFLRKPIAREFLEAFLYYATRPPTSSGLTFAT